MRQSVFCIFTWQHCHLSPRFVTRWSSRDNEPTFARGRRTSGTRLGGSYSFVRACSTVAIVSEATEPSLFDFLATDQCAQELDDVETSIDLAKPEIEIQRQRHYFP